MKRNLGLAFLALSLAATTACGADKKEENVVEADQVEEDKAAEEEAAEVSETETETSSEGAVVEQVISTPLAFSIPKKDVDPENIYEHDRFSVEAGMASENILVSGDVYFDRQESVSGNEEYKQISVMEEQIYQAVIGSGPDVEKVKRFKLYQSILTPDGVEKPLSQIATIELAIHADNGTYELRGDSGIESEMNGLELRNVLLSNGSLFLAYTSPENKEFQTDGAQEMIIAQKEIGRDGKLGETKTLAQLNPESFAFQGIIPTNKGLAAYDSTEGIIPLNGENEWFKTDVLSLDPNDEPLYFNEDSHIALYREDNEEGVTLYNLNTQETVETNHQLNEMAYQNFTVAGYDPEKEYLYVLASADAGYGIESSIHVLDKNFEETGDIYPVNTNTMDTSSTEDGFVLWSTDENAEPALYTASKVIYIGRMQK